MGVMSKNQKKKKRNYNSQLEYRKTSRGANEISKLPQAKCLRAEIDETCNKFREQCWFFSQKKKLSAGEKSSFYLLKWNMFADLEQRLGVKKKYQQNVSERELK